MKAADLYRAAFARNCAAPADELLHIRAPTHAEMIEKAFKEMAARKRARDSHAQPEVVEAIPRAEEVHSAQGCESGDAGAAAAPAEPVESARVCVKSDAKPHMNKRKICGQSGSREEK